jgi:hypothetical protein
LVYFDPERQIPEDWLPRGRWKGGGCAMHTFCDDYRQEFFWRRPMEGAIIANAAGVVTAPDFTVYLDDPPEWAAYQCWRSLLVASFWQSFGVAVLPVVAFRGAPECFVSPGSVWAARGAGRNADLALWRREMLDFELRARPAKIVVFGNQVSVPGLAAPLIGRALFSRRTERGENDGRA